ncbi:MAG: thioredoxin [Hyphomicrobiales bacterium]|nr:thioredoxin [Hyphomicrobiales bacterium]MCP5370499.1 thioredoxin [Hyphomicrobiales bacterium]
MELIVNPDGSPGAGGGTGGGAGGDLIKETDTARFMADVIEASRQVPVIVDFWAPWCGPCKQLGPMLEKAVRQAGGMVRMVKVNVDENQQLAQQMRVQSIPAVYAFKNGQPVDAFVGAQAESQIKSFVERLMGGQKAPIDQALEQAQQALAAGDAQTAGAIYNEVLAQDPANTGALAGLIRCFVQIGELDHARELADSLETELRQTPEVAAAITALELAGAGSSDAEVEELRAKLAADANDHQARFDLATALFARGQAEAAMDELLEIIRRKRDWNEEAARTQLLKIFEALGPMDPLVAAARRRLSSILFS